MKKIIVLLLLQIFLLQAFAVHPKDSFFIGFKLPDATHGDNSSVERTNAFLNSFIMEKRSQSDVVPLTAFDTIPADNSNFQFMGRVDFTDAKKPLFANANTTINTKFQGKSVSMLLKQYSGVSFSINSFYAFIDNGDPLKISTLIGTTNYKIADNLSDGTHTLKLIKITEGFCGQCQFLGLILEKGKKLEAPDELPSFKMEYYGASTTVGYGIEGGARPGSDNSYKADPAVCARELNAQLSVVSLSGFGVAVGWTGLISSIWNKTIPFTASPAPANNTWDFSNYTPDVVVTILAANDYNATGGIKDGKLTVDQFVSANKSFILKLRSKYPDAKIVCTNSTMLYEPGFTIMNNAVKRSVDEVVSNGDTHVFYFGFPLMKGGGFNGHPSVTDGINNGKALSVFIKNILLVGIDEKKVEQKISVYPNPTSDVLNIKMEKDGCMAIIKLYSGDGRLIYSKTTLNDLEQIDLTNYQVSGFVLVEVNKAGNTDKFKVLIR